MCSSLTVRYCAIVIPAVVVTVLLLEKGSVWNWHLVLYCPIQPLCVSIQFRGAAQHTGSLRHLRGERHEGSPPGPTYSAQDPQGQCRRSCVFASFGYCSKVSASAEGHMFSRPLATVQWSVPKVTCSRVTWPLFKGQRRWSRCVLASFGHCSKVISEGHVFSRHLASVQRSVLKVTCSRVSWPLFKGTERRHKLAWKR